ncbi:MAG: HigA family addiction module antidote protein [Chlorobi bacterium]|nr:HigA family addiction module antidote protein [Chlorobiota bacterium]
MTHIKKAPFHPGQILKEEYLDELQISQTELASALGTTFRTINEIVNEKRNISVETAMKLSKYFSTGVEFWLNLQNQYDVYKTYNKKKKVIDKVLPLKKRKKILKSKAKK